MERITTIKDMRQCIQKLKRSEKTIGFVPTMGYLHEGHLSLVDKAKKHSDIVIMSIFVNPTQFGPHEDFDSYPRDIERDEALAESRGTDIIFYPDTKDMYPSEILTWVNVEKITDVLCGAGREGHFRGVTTVVTKLFNIVKPDIAIFGQKDAQQAAVISKMVEDLNMDIEIKLAPIVREADGLAMSSRNVRSSMEDRKNAKILSQSLFMIKEGISEGDELSGLLKKAKNNILKTPGAQLDYFEARSYPNLEAINTCDGRCLVAIAVFFGDVRLIDNILIENAS
ncbi:MAG: pantoate--beta-alanine ligase [Candidatus Marinimicrobia bacterium]|nr:pantoate--beta-alanine ligase [Candidatus Neomarinimicrobiota bacterium]